MVEIETGRLALAYGMLILPFGLLLWLRSTVLSQTVIAILRMTIQLLFVGLYLQAVFALDHYLLTALWLVIMLIVADLSVVRGCGLRMKIFAGPLFLALLLGTVGPLAYFILIVLGRPDVLEARYAIPIGGMILGNCLRADIIGVKQFYQALSKDRKAFRLSLVQGAERSEAFHPYEREAFQAALVPQIASIATIGLVSLPGMMTGVILGAGNPMEAIKYQIAIMIAILTGTALTVSLAIRLTVRHCFDGRDRLRPDVFVAPSSSPDRLLGFLKRSGGKGARSICGR